MTALVCLFAITSADYRAPAGTRPPLRRAGAETVLPGGRVITPLGRHIPVGAGTAALAVNPRGNIVVTVNTGPPVFSVTVTERRDRSRWEVKQYAAEEPVAEESGLRDPMGLAFISERDFFLSEGASGRVVMLNAGSGKPKHVFDLKEPGMQAAYSGDLAFDRTRQILFAADPANSRIVILDARRRRLLSSAALEQPPLAIAISPDGRTLYATTRRALFLIDVSDAAAPRVEASVEVPGGGALKATADLVFVADRAQDSITIVDTAARKVAAEIPLRIPGLESFRGIAPSSLEYHAASGWLLAAETGINAIGVIDVAGRQVLGHIPTAAAPTRVALFEDTVYVASARGFGGGPNASRQGPLRRSLAAELRRGALSMFPLPERADLAKLTERVRFNNGFMPRGDPPALPAEVRHVVLILKGSRTFDEVLGDIEYASNGPVNGAPTLARFGRHGYILQSRESLQQRLGVRNVNITPNHHALALGWSLSDNFYAGPDRLPLRPLLKHLEHRGVALREFGDSAADLNIPDQDRATRFIQDVERLGKGVSFPGLLVLHLPNDRIGKPRLEDGYPFDASYVADNDLALGRVVQFLSRTPQWRNLVIFVTEETTRGGVDHVDSNRTFLIAAGPYARKNYVSHVNSGFAGLVKTITRLLGVPPLSLLDAAASDLSDMFTATPDFTAFEHQPVRADVFDPAKLRRRP